ncbi:class I SAM-dependent methyltransferase [Paenibacillus sp. OAS669]|uniref:class I SAM-dependent methyltransferase n=1 Tax=Paenibacillus sp. OAS669 TaxID=2663821 RepID=UPI00178A3C8E|nr:class I SAM-dependent methyltransferase [Paenibacillus sp. OAS669]MBE1440783.1 ubiquinone/menaquinone biosynthesis C-methylase UbiE [Paenibacillus sp. OAS669]
MSSFFHKTYDLWMQPLEHYAFGAIRKRLIGQARGKVLEIGAGTGANFKYYKSANQVVAVEPDEVMLKKSLPLAEASAVPIHVVRAGAESLPFEEDTFDCVAGTLVFCTIPDPMAAWREITRVCKPGGHIILMEHVRISHPVWGTLQDWLTPWWKRCCGGCHLNRTTLDDLQQAGLHIIELEQMFNGLFVIAKAVNNKACIMSGKLET